MKICFLINSLGKGGAEKIVCDFSEFLVSVGEQVVILTTDNEKEVNFVSDKVKKDILYSRFSYPSKLIPLSFLIHIFKFLNYIKREKIETTISFLTRSNLLNIIAGFFSKRKVYIYERSILSKIYDNKTIHKRFIFKTIIFLYGRASKIFVLSEFAKKDLIINGIDSTKIYVIPNPVKVLKSKSYLLDRNIDGKSIISISTCSRLIKSKNVDFIISVIDSLNNQPNPMFKFTLNIIGDGDEYHNLKYLVQRKNLQTAVLFSGWVKNPIEILAQTDIFLFASDYEGFGNVILEAMSVGLPIVAYNSKGGVEDILNNGQYGVAIKDLSTASFMEELMNLCLDSISYHNYCEASIERANHFSMDRIASLLLKEIK